MTTTNLITVWDDPKNIDLLIKLYGQGLSFQQIADEIGQGVTRNACIGKVKRMKLPAREDRHAQSRYSARTVGGREGHRGASGGLGQAKANSIVHRVEGRLKAERARQEGRLSHFGEKPFMAGSVPDMDDGVDVTHLVAFADRNIGKDCSWIPGDPRDGAMCCGKPVVEGSQWCPEHHARVYNSRAAG